MKIRGKRGVVTLSHCVLHTFALTGHKLNILKYTLYKILFVSLFLFLPLDRVIRCGQEVFNNDVGQGENISLFKALIETELGSELVTSEHTKTSVNSSFSCSFRSSL